MSDFNPPAPDALDFAPTTEAERAFRRRYAAVGLGLPGERVFEPEHNAPVPAKYAYATCQQVLVEPMGTGSWHNDVTRRAMRSTFRVSAYRDDAMERIMRLCAWLDSPDAREAEAKHGLIYIDSSDITEADWRTEGGESWEARSIIDVIMAWSYELRQMHNEAQSARIVIYSEPYPEGRTVDASGPAEEQAR